jgi:hypothetical protein
MTFPTYLYDALNDLAKADQLMMLGMPGAETVRDRALYHLLAEWERVKKQATSQGGEAA